MMTMLLLSLFLMFLFFLALGVFGFVFWADSFETFLGWLLIVVVFSTVTIVSLCCFVG